MNVLADVAGVARLRRRPFHAALRSMQKKKVTSGVNGDQGT